MLEPTNLIMVTIADAQGYSANTSAYFLTEQTLTVAQLLTVAGVWIGRLQDASGGRVVLAHMRLDVDVSPYADKAIEPTTNTTQCASLKFTNDQDALAYDFLVPAVSVDVISGGGPDFTPGDTLDRLVSMMDGTDATLDGFTFATNRGGSLVASTGGFLTSRKHNQRTSRLSIRVVP
jgi:hypothetical protein